MPRVRATSAADVYELQDGGDPPREVESCGGADEAELKPRHEEPADEDVDDHCNGRYISIDRILQLALQEPLEGEQEHEGEVEGDEPYRHLPGDGRQFRRLPHQNQDRRREEVHGEEEDGAEEEHDP